MPWSTGRARRPGRLTCPPLYRFHDAFQVPDPNPLSNPRIADPGPGTWAVNDLDGQFSVNFSALVLGGGSAGWDRAYLFGEQSFQRRAGRFLEFEFTPLTTNYMRCGWQKARSGLIGDNAANFYVAGSGFIEVIDNLDVVQVNIPYAAATESYRFRIYDTGEGFDYWLMVAPEATWAPIWRKTISNSRLSEVWPAIQGLSVTGTMQWFRIRDSHVPPPIWRARQCCAGLTAAGAADALHEIWLTVPASGTAEYRFREVDEDNFWSVVVDADADEVYLNLTDAGVTTTEDTYALGLPTAEGFRLRVLAWEDRLRTFLGLTQMHAVTDSTHQDGTLCGPDGANEWSDWRVDSRRELAD